MAVVTIRLVRGFGLVALFLAAALFGIASGVVLAFVGDLPQISALDSYAPSTITRVVGRDGGVVGEFATERREIITDAQIPPVLRQAIMAVEDAGFNDHMGLQPTRMVWAVVRDLTGTGRTPGRSTITQQLARNLFRDTIGFRRDPNAWVDVSGWERKIKEALVALQIERRYGKSEIFTMYCNQIYWGHGAYGVQAASRLYFDKSITDLTLEEAAMLAGIIQTPERQSPYVNMAEARRKRNLALDRMAANNFITPEEATAAKARPIVTSGAPLGGPTLAPHFTETIRQELQDRYGAKAIYESGLTVRTGLDAELQRTAIEVLDRELRRIDRLGGYRRPARNLVAEKVDLDTFRVPRWSRPPTVNDVIPALVLNMDKGTIRVRAGAWEGTIAAAGYAWTRRRSDTLVRRGDLIEVRVISRVDESKQFVASLEQTPSIEGAVVAIENRTGQILAMVGGHNFGRSQFNRATQALRQVGSTFKPFVYTAAIDRGYTATSLIDDSPVSFVAGPNQPLWQPQNYDREYLGQVMLRDALAGSRNIPTIKLMDALGPPQVIGTAKRMGITSPLPAFLPVAIGAAEATLIEMTSAYSAFANQGVRVTPLSYTQVLDRDGNILEDRRPVPHDALRADTAFVMAHLLQGAVQHGTAVRAQVLDWPVGGKTGTTDDYTDAWFIGFDPDITLGVWVGRDQKKPIGPGQTGTAAALPIWIDIMKPWVARRRAQLPAPPSFERPSNVIMVMTSKGLEAFIAGTEPGIR
ncbi:MAG TPA: PBP1A family penicillin-binding protein [Vicinamibacterales bacterium]|jgi:penicillin-binding protein 1A|nr:PBP1A family penicillin-binding protein [Acidobacteriota bacterium]HQX81659.1 PBP1A family penicillin-binding protein [Vicinamibacterales bacterium]